MAGLACGDHPVLYWVRTLSGCLLPASGGGQGRRHGCSVCRAGSSRNILDIHLDSGGPVVHTTEADQRHHRGGEPSQKVQLQTDHYEQSHQLHLDEE